MLTNDQLGKWDRENFFHPSTNLGQFARGEAPQRIVTGGEGCHITDRDGNRLLDGFDGKLTSSKWAKLTKTSPDTALRDINDLVARGILVRDPGGGRSTSYSLVLPDALPGRP